MTDLRMADFEAGLEQRLVRHAAIPVRPVDADAVAHAAVAGGRRARLWQLPRADAWPTRRPAWASVAILVTLALILVIAFALIVAGAMRLLPTPPIARNGVIAYQVREFGANEDGHVRLLNPDGTGDHELARGLSPAFTPDGTRIAYIATVKHDHEDPDLHVAVSAADGTAGSEHVVENHFIGFVPSPDGSKVAVGIPAQEGLLPGDGAVIGTPAGIWLVDVATGSKELLVPAAPDGSGRFWDQYTWSPDGTRIAYAVLQEVSNGSDHGAYRAAIDVVDVAPRAVRRVTPRPGTDVDSMSWSPDGHSIAYAGLPDGAPLPILGTEASLEPPQDVFLIHLDGTGESNLTSSPQTDFDPHWSPDGSVVAWFTGDETSPPSVAVRRVDGTRPVGDPHVGDLADEVMWAPDGTSLVTSTTHAVGSGESSDDYRTVFQVVPASMDRVPTVLLDFKGYGLLGSWQRLDP